MKESIDLRKYWALLRRWWWLVVLCTILAAGGAYVVSAQRPPVYMATTTLLVQPPSTLSSQVLVYRYAQDQAPTYIQMMTGQPVLEAAFQELEGKHTFNGTINGISANLIPETQLVQLSVTGSDPADVAVLSNAIADAFITRYQSMQQGRYTEGLAALQAQMDYLSTEMANVQRQIGELGTPKNTQEQAELSLLQSTLAGYHNTYSLLVRDYQQVNMLSVQAADSVAIYERARVPTTPIPSHTSRNTILAGGVGALLAIGVIFLVEYLDDTIKSPDDIQAALDLGTLGIIGRLGKDDGELVVTSRPLSPISEAFRKLRTNIRFSSLDRSVKTLLLTSPGPTEGKSTAVANLAVALAQSGLQVAVLDADLRRPRMHHIFGLHPRAGLTGSLLDGNVDGNLQAVEGVEGLVVLPAGERPPNPAEVLGSRRMQEILAELGQQADIVLIDTPPVLPVTDAVVLSRSVDGVLLLVDAGKTHRRLAQQAIEELNRVGAHIVGAVLNRVPTNHRGGYYYYYHESYSEDGTKKRSKRQRSRSKKGLLSTMRRMLGQEQKDPV